MTAGNEAFSRVVIDAQLADQGWKTQEANSVRYEYVLPDGTRADYVLCDRHGRSIAVIEAKRFSISPGDAAEQAKTYALQLNVPYIFLANGQEIQFWEWEREAWPRPVKTFFKQDDLERRFATRQVRQDPLGVSIDQRVAGRDYQMDCINVLCREIVQGRRKLLVEMATGAGKTRMAAAFIKRMFQANAITRVLFLVDRIPLAKQTEDAFVEYLPDYPCYVLRAGRRFQDEKQITITTLQSMINSYGEYSSGYFDLVISDECHRSIYGKWSGVLKHFDGIQVGLTATPSVMTEEFDDEEDQLFVRDTLRFFEVDRPTFTYKLKDAIRDGYLAPYQIYKAKTVKTAAEGGFEVRRDELDWSAMDAGTKAEFEKLFGENQSINVDPSALERRFTIPERNRAMVREFRQVLDNGYTDHKGVLRKPQIGKTIVFAVTKRHAETLAQMLDDAFRDWKDLPEVRYADYVVSGMGSDDTLDGMSKIRRFKKEAQKKAAEIIPALFLDMFGDPATNPKGWEMAPLGIIAEVVSGVTKGRKFNGKKTVMVPYLRVANVQANFLDLTELKEIEVLPSDVQALTLQHGDILLTEGGDFDKLGRGALWEHDVPNCIHQNHVFRVRLDKHNAIPEFFVSYLQSNKAREYFLRSAKRTTNLASINMTQLRSLPVLLPPLELQAAFLERFQSMRSVSSQQGDATAKAEATFDALLGGVFG